MANTYSLIGTVIVTSSAGAASLDFSSIPATYTDLVLKLSSRTDRPTSGYGYFDLVFNNSTANQTFARLNGYASGVNTTGNSTQNIIASNTGDATANTFSNFETYLTNYAGSYYKSMSIEAGLQDVSGVRETPFNQLGAGLWSSITAINRITVSIASGYGTIFYQNTTCSLYGILKA